MTDVRTTLQDALQGRFTLERELGGGGMSRVFVAREDALGRDVVVKVLAPELAAGLSVERFTREIRLAATLQEPHIVPVLSAGETGTGLPYYVMPFVVGESLRARLAAGPLPVGEAVAILRDMLRALAYAHARGVVHRDIKPENVLLSSGTAVVTDFGIAKAISAAKTRSDGAPEMVSGTLTSIGTSLGTPAYMAPEQAAGDVVDARADLYAWGVVAYELLAGKHPFGAKPTAQQWMAAHLSESPAPLGAVTPNVPPALAALVTRCLAKDPTQRPGDGELLTALDGPTIWTSPAAGTTSAAYPTARASAANASAHVASAANASRGRGATFAAASLLVVALAGGGWWMKSRGAASSAPPVAERTTDVRSIAVLPFENLGDSADAYFADGITDAVRGKLTAVPGMSVIARASSVQYRHSSKSPQQIAQELGVRYLLTGTVRWAKEAGKASSVQVSPELVEVASGGSPQSRWQQPFDADVANVFKVQADIASKVAEAMRIAIGGSEQTKMARAPTANAAAYDAYLRGMEAYGTGARRDAVPLRRAIGYFEQAVALDPNFTEAWGNLSYARALLFSNVVADPALGRAALEAAQRATRDSTSALGHRVLAAYYRLVSPDFPRSVQELQTALRLAPGDAAAHNELATTRQLQGDFDAALRERQAALALDPRSGEASINLAITLLNLRRYADARIAADRGLALAPSSLIAIEYRAMIELGDGKLDAARRVIATAAKDVNADALAGYFATYWDLGWVLDDAMQRRVLALGAEAFDDDRAQLGLIRAQLYRWRGDTTSSRIWADTARLEFEKQLKTRQEEAQTRALLGLALAHLGRDREATEQAERSVALAPIGGNASTAGYYVQSVAAHTYAIVGDRTKAMDTIEMLLATPGFLSAAWARLDPTFAPLHGDPRFERLAAGAK